MPSGFNLGVAEFAQLDATGHPTSSEVAREVSDWLFEAIRNETSQLPAALRINSRGPGDIGIVPGRDRDARAASAAEVAARHNATILVYGAVSAGDSEVQVGPEFYVSDRSFGYGCEVAGPDRLGKPVTTTLPFDPNSTMDVNERLRGRVAALRHLVSGLGYYYVGSYEEAWAKFRRAADVSSWEPEEGQEVVYMLMGAADLELYDQTRDLDPLARAADSFARAYQLNRDYARCYLGLGTVAFQQAVSHSEPGVDAEKLLEAAGWYSQSLKASDQPDSAHISVRADYCLGQVYLAGYEGQVPGWSGEQAARYFEQVIAAYDQQRTPDLVWFAGYAYALLGRLAGLEEDWPEVSARCHQAIDLLEDIPHNPSRASIARYWSWIAVAEEQQDQPGAARDAYRQAIQQGTGVVSLEELQGWQSELDRLEKGTR
jgi:tetratricopeptide (TPR) repeat protein